MQFLHLNPNPDSLAVYHRCLVLDRRKEVSLLLKTMAENVDHVKALV